MNTQEQIERFEFAIVLDRELNAAPPNWPFRAAKLASDLIKAHRRLHRMAEQSCNGFRNGEEDAHDRKVERFRAKVVEMLKPYGIGAVFGGDPRGAVLQLTLPRTKRTNGWGGEGYVVPR